MKSIILFCAICLQIDWSYGHPSDSEGVGAFAYQDSTGTRYGGTYDLKDGQVVNTKGDFPPDFTPPSFEAVDYFVPEYFRNLDNILQETFDSNTKNHKLAFNAARKAFDLTSNQAGYIPNFAFRFPFSNFPPFGGFPGMPRPGAVPPGFGFPRPSFDYGNSAFASASAGPGFVQQEAAIDPANPDMPNIQHFSETAPVPGRKSYSVSSSSFSSSRNVNGKEENHRGAETVVNDNGKVTKYKVQN